jgi:hypothetical protein
MLKPGWAYSHRREQRCGSPGSAEEDRKIGALWAEMSDGQCLFVMAKEKNGSGSMYCGCNFQNEVYHKA